MKTFGNFNSIKVRLKHQLTKRMKTQKHHFNSIKVRLKRREHTADGTRHRFQFHKGTIKTPASPTYIEADLDFNSIKVRLKRMTEACRGVFVWFQFHKGTIKTLRKAKAEVDNADFNSIKVRLKPVVELHFHFFVPIISIP